MSSIMTDQERIRHIQEQARSIVSRNKCVDASLQTMINQSKACSQKSGNSFLAPTTVAGVKNYSGQGLEALNTSLNTNGGGFPTNVVARGVGTGGEYFGILQVAQGNAIGPATAPADTGVTPVITLPVPCINMQAPPFTQQNLSTMYVAPCTNPGKRDYFPAPIYDGPGCTYNRITTPS
jgi:hypothetical protein